MALVNKRFSLALSLPDPVVMFGVGSVGDETPVCCHFVDSDDYRWVLIQTLPSVLLLLVPLLVVLSASLLLVLLLVLLIVPTTIDPALVPGLFAK